MKQACLVSGCSPHNEEGHFVPIRVFVGPRARERAEAWVKQENIGGEAWSFRVDPVPVTWTFPDKGDDDR
jgi:hypothetical protein